MTRRRAAVLATAALVAGAVTVGFVLLTPATGIAFDSRAWKHDSSYSVRRSMVDDLVHNVLEPGMSYRRIRVLLGRPDVDLLSQMRYLLGDSETLILDLPGLKYQRAEIRNED